MSNGLSLVLERLDGAAQALAEKERASEALQQELRAGREALDTLRGEALALTAAETRTQSESLVRWRWIQEQYGLDALLERLDGYPAALAEGERAQESLQQELKAAREVLAAREAETLAEVCAEVNDAGKPAYSNDTQRQAETKRRLAADPGAAHLREQASSLEHQLALARIDHAEVERQWQAARLRANVLGDMFRALAPR